MCGCGKRYVPPTSVQGTQAPRMVAPPLPSEEAPKPSVPVDLPTRESPEANRRGYVIPIQGGAGGLPNNMTVSEYDRDLETNKRT